MPCHAAIVEKALVLKDDITVEDALLEMKKKKAEVAPVINKDKMLVGMFSYQILMRNLLPVSVAMSDGIQLDVKLPAAPGIAKRLKKVLPLQVETVMERKDIQTIYAESPLWEGVNLLVQYNQPLCVIEPETNKYIGIITQESAYNELQRLKDSET